MDYTISTDNALKSSIVSKEISFEISEKEKKKGEYLKFAQEDKALIGKYASKHGMAKAMRLYRILTTDFVQKS